MANPHINGAVRDAVHEQQALRVNGLLVHYHADESPLLQGWLHTWYVERDGKPIVVNASWPHAEAPERLWVWAERALKELIEL